MGPKKPFGWILGRFEKILKRFWEGWDKNLEGFRAFWASNGQILEMQMLGIIWLCCGQASKLDPRADPPSVTVRRDPHPSLLDPEPKMN